MPFPPQQAGPPMGAPPPMAQPAGPPPMGGQPGMPPMDPMMMQMLMGQPAQPPGGDLLSQLGLLSDNGAGAMQNADPQMIMALLMDKMRSAGRPEDQMGPPPEEGMEGEDGVGGLLAALMAMGGAPGGGMPQGMPMGGGGY